MVSLKSNSQIYCCHERVALSKAYSDPIIAIAQSISLKICLVTLLLQLPSLFLKLDQMTGVFLDHLVILVSFEKL